MSETTSSALHGVPDEGRNVPLVPTSSDGRLDAFEVSGSSPPIDTDPWSSVAKEDERRALNEYCRSWPRETKRLMDVHIVPESAIPYTLVYRSWPVPDAKLWERLPRDMAVPLAFAVQTGESPIFTIDRHQLDAVMQSADASPTALPLPPLPFDSLVLETSLANLAFLDGGRYIYMEAACITESLRGVVWDAQVLVYATTDSLTENPSQMGRHFIFSLRLTEDQLLQRGTDGTWVEMNGGHLGRTLVEAAHILTGRGVTHEAPSRLARRVYERVSRQKWPTNAWLIKIGDDRSVASEGGSGRRLTCRFWVRGHWAKLPAGKAPSGRVDSRATPDGFMVWREAYVKGPAGAPWRTPIHPVRALSAA